MVRVSFCERITITEHRVLQQSNLLLLYVVVIWTRKRGHEQTLAIYGHAMKWIYVWVVECFRCCSRSRLYQMKWYSATQFYICFVLLQNYVYFGNNQDPVINIFNKTSLSNISSFRLFDGTGRITDMAMFASDMQPSAISKYILWLLKTGNSRLINLRILTDFSKFLQF